MGKCSNFFYGYTEHVKTSWFLLPAEVQPEWDVQAHMPETLQGGKLRGRQETKLSQERHQPELSAPLVCSNFVSFFCCCFSLSVSHSLCVCLSLLLFFFFFCYLFLSFAFSPSSVVSIFSYFLPCVSSSSFSFINEKALVLWNNIALTTTMWGVVRVQCYALIIEMGGWPVVDYCRWVIAWVWIVCVWFTNWW